jgi:rubrerythrin
MSNDVTRCIEILSDAIAFEEEGIRFFTTKAESTMSGMGKTIFLSLAKDEQGHRAHLIELRDDLIRTHDLEPLGVTAEEHRTAKQIFETAIEEVKDPYEYKQEDLEILEGAMAVESKGYHMYASAAAEMTSPDAKKLFEHLATEEQDHYTLLKNTFDYIKDPAGWHEYEEGGMMDGA